MLKRITSKKKGFTIIEVLCSLTIISILFTYIVHVELNNLRVKNYIEAKYMYTKLLEASVAELNYNCSYSDLVSLNDSGKLYILKENLNFYSLFNNDIKTNCSNNTPTEKPYIFLSINKDKVIKITASLYFKFMNKEEVIKCEFYKGNYQE